MPRTLSSRTETEIAKKVGVKPFYLVYIGYGTPLRKSSGPTVTWDGNSWIADDMLVHVNPDKNEGSIKIGNTDFVFGNKVQGTTIVDIPIKIYALYGDSPYAVADAELLPDGVGGAPVVGLRWVTFKVEKSSTQMMYCPRVMCTKAIGFNYLPPEGSVLSWEGEQFKLED